MAFHKTTVEIDVDELSKAAQRLGTEGIKETVNCALKEVNRRAALEDAAAYVLAGKLQVPGPESWAAWREPRR